MESKSEPGRINLSETTHHEIENEFPCEYRGEIEVKNRGPLKMYFLS
jgi:class 3 adenylate cyclase